MKYRPEIDGLRAVAVSSVILSHANFTAFGGGFVGVDIFFVISGYLITHIILDEYQRGEFSPMRFYERRARRILPALFFVLVCTIPPAWMWLLPDAYERFSKSLITAVFSVSNFYFLKKTDYFSVDAGEVPLLHTWSLGVEEQFYILFPLLFLFCFKVKNIFKLAATIAIASLVLSEIGARGFPSANYYLLPFRAWEILAGALCAFYVHRKSLDSNNLLAAAGLLMIGISIFFFNSSTRIPSIVALLPVGGTALFLLFAARDTLAGKLLSVAPMVWIGRVSFSAYLFHQPIFAFWRIRNMEDPSTITMAGLVGLTLVCASLSWRFVEQPFRHVKANTRQIIGAVSACVAIMVAFGGFGVINEGIPSRLPIPLTSFIDRTTWSNKCLFQVEGGMPSIPDQSCVFNVGAAKTNAIWGDSISSSIAPALEEAMKARGEGLIQLTYGFCAPINKVSSARNEGAVNCDEFNRRALDFLIKSNVDTVTIAASWVNFLNSDYMRIDGNEFSGGQGIMPRVSARFRATIEQLQNAGKRVVIVYPHPRFSQEVRSEMVAQFIKGNEAPDFEYSYEDFKANTARAYAVLDAAMPKGVGKVFPEKIFCGASANEMCFFGRHGIAYIADRGHFTHDGAEMVVERIMGELSDAKTASPTALNVN